MSNQIATPDVLSCLANLSNDEVFTPPRIVNEMLDLLPQELWSDLEATFLDPCCKSGVFLREIAKRLIKGLQTKIPDMQERLDHICSKQLFGIAITELTSLISRRSLYCSKFANGEFSICDNFLSESGNIYFVPTEHVWKDGKCIYCNANEDVLKRGSDRESYAYPFIHKLSISELGNMKFDVIIGNPPYQMSDGGQGASAKPLYHLFVEQAKKLNPRYLVMIIPARWYAGGKGLDKFREDMLSDGHIVDLYDYKNSADCFPGVNVAGGVCFFKYDKTYNGPCNIHSVNGNEQTVSSRYLNEFSVLIRDNIGIDIVRKVLSLTCGTMDQYVQSRNLFCIPTTAEVHEKRAPNDLPVLTSKGSYYINSESVKQNDWVDVYKVIITYAMSGGNKPSSDGKYQVISSLKILYPGEVCSETYLCLNRFDDVQKAESFCSFMRCKTARYLLLQALSSIHITKESFMFVPVLPWDKEYNDGILTELFHLTEDENAEIVSTIKDLAEGD